MEIKYILFDLDGVIMDSKDSIIESTNQTLSHFNMTYPFDDYSKIIGPPLRRIYGEFFNFGDRTDEAVRYYKKHYAEEGVKRIALFDGVPEMLGELFAHGKKLMVATARESAITQSLLAAHGILQYFCYIGSIDSGSNGGPASVLNGKSEVISHVLTENGIFDRENAVMVGDRAEDMSGGRENGLMTIGALYGYGGKEELEASGADHIAESPLAISRYIIERYE